MATATVSVLAAVAMVMQTRLPLLMGVDAVAVVMETLVMMVRVPHREWTEMLALQRHTGVIMFTWPPQYRGAGPHIAAAKNARTDGVEIVKFAVFGNLRIGDWTTSRLDQ